MIDYEVVDFYKISGAGFMLTVDVGSGQITKFDRLLLKSPRGGVNIDIVAVVPGRPGTGLVGIQPRPFDATAVADGFRRNDEGGYEILSLRLTVAAAEAKKWWEIWK